MGPYGSTVIGPPGAGPARLGELAALGPPDELAALLTPMVARAVRTERGPAALVHWIRRHPGPRPTESAAPTLAQDLARLLFDAPGTQDDTLDDL